MDFAKMLLNLVLLLDEVTEENQEKLVDAMAAAAAEFIEDSEVAEKLYLALGSENLVYFVERLNFYVNDEDEEDQLNIFDD